MPKLACVEPTGTTRHMPNREDLLKRKRLEGALWIVEPGRIRAHTHGGEDPDA